MTQMLMASGGVLMPPPADSGNGGGYSIDQGTAGGVSIGTESNTITSASTNYLLDTCCLLYTSQSPRDS